MGYSSHILLWWKLCIRQKWHRISTPHCPFIFMSFLISTPAFPPALSPSHLSPFFGRGGGQLSFNFLVPLFDFELTYTAAAETGKERKNHGWSPPLLIFAGPPSGRTCEFAPRRVWCRDVPWRYWVMRDSWRVTRWEKPLSGWVISPRCWRRLKENWELPTHEMVMLLLLIHPKSSRQTWITHFRVLIFMVVWESDFCNSNSSYPNWMLK